MKANVSHPVYGGKNFINQIFLPVNPGTTCMAARSHGLVGHGLSLRGL
jgi:hypothetical protein